MKMNVQKDNKNRMPYFYIAILIALIILNSLLARFGVIAYPVVPGVSALYFAVAFMIAFTLWFGAWGAIAAYIGCFIGAGLGYVPLDVNLYWSLANLWQVLIPLAAFKALNADVGLGTRRDFFIFLAFGWILNSIIGAAWGTSMLAIGGVDSWNDVPYTFIGWFIGNLIVTIAITPLLLRFSTPSIEKAGILVKKYWA